MAWQKMGRASLTHESRKKLQMEVKWLSKEDFQVWMNDVYQAAVYEKDPPAEGLPPIVHLSIKRIDQKPIHDWRALQRIKNDICGPEREAVEIFPRESRLVDSANQYHLWVLAEGHEVPFGFFGRYVRDGASRGTVNETFGDDRPADCLELSEEQFDKDLKAANDDKKAQDARSQD